MARKIIDDVTNLSTPKKMMIAIDENFTELYNDVAVNNKKVGVTDQISSLVEDTSPQLGGDLDLNGHTIQGMTTGGLGAVVEDTSPQLGGDLDLNGHTILNLPVSGISEVVEDSTPQLGGTLDTNGNNIDNVTPAELNRVHGVTSPIQSQIDSKIGNLVEDTSPQLGGDLDLNGHTITGLSTGGLGSVAEDTTPQLGGNLDTNGHNIDNVTPTELNHVHGTTSSIQGQIDSKIEKVEDDTAPKLGGDLDLNGHTITGLSTGGLGSVAEDTTPQLGGNLDTNGHNIDNVTPTELNHVHGTTSNIQTQLDSKIASLEEDPTPKLGGNLNLNGYIISDLKTGLDSVVEDTSPKLGGTLDTNGNNIDNVTPAELNRVHGVTSPIQSQIDSKISELKDDVSPQLGGDLDLNGHSILSLPVPDHNATGNLNAGDYQHLTAAQKSGLTGGIITTLHKHDIKEDTTPQLGGTLHTNGYNIDNVTPAELNRVHGVTSPIQDQIDIIEATKISKVSEDASPKLGGDLDLNGHTIGDVTATELNYVHGVTSAIQNQINTKIGNLVEDTNPQLGGNLDLNGYTIPGLDSTGGNSTIASSAFANNIVTNFLMMNALSLPKQKIVNGFVDEFEDETGLDIASHYAYTPPYCHTDSSVENQLLSVNIPSIDIPDNASLYIWHEEIDSVIINTDLKGYVSRETPQKFDTDYTSGNQILCTNHGYENNDKVYLYMESGTLPEGLTSEQIYYVVNATKDNFEVSLTCGGAAILLSSNKSTGDTAYVLKVNSASLTVKSQLNTGTLLSDTIDISDQKYETEMRYLITTHNGKLQKFHGVALCWDAGRQLYTFFFYATTAISQSANIKISLPANKKIIISWGDGASTTILGEINQVTYSHTYANIKTYYIKITGDYNDISSLEFIGDGTFSGNIKNLPSNVFGFYSKIGTGWAWRLNGIFFLGKDSDPAGAPKIGVHYTAIDGIWRI